MTKQPDPFTVLRQLAAGLVALADVLEAGPAAPPELMSLSDLPVSPRVARRMIRDGQLAAVRVGREYRVRRDDADRAFAPTVRPPRPRRGRESEAARVRRQLEAAGVTVGNDTDDCATEPSRPAARCARTNR
jgi:excisionase family DNA binding protein